jgi:hypothetical protein
LAIDLFGADADSIKSAIMSPAPDGDDWSFKFLQEFFADPDAVQNLDSASANILFMIVMRAVFFRIGAHLPSSSGYEPLLIKHGFPFAIARMLSKLAVRHGRRRAKEAKRYRAVFAAIRFLGRRRRQTRAILTRARLLLKACEETSIIHEIFDRAGVSEEEFLDLLRSAVEGRVDSERISEIAAGLLPYLSSTHGPKVSAPSAAFEFILEGRDDFEKSGPFCSDDALAEATKREFGLEEFDGRPARRRLKSRRK